jgi:hypothetical protein
MVRLGESLYKDWRALLPPSALPDEVFKEAVAGVLQQVRKRKREIEGEPFGWA